MDTKPRYVENADTNAALKAAWQTPRLRKTAITARTQEGLAGLEDGQGLSSGPVDR